MLIQLKKEIQNASNKERALHSMAFFKTKKGEYGAGDIFWGLTVPQSRIIAKHYSQLELSDIEKLLASKYHEERLIALLILIEQFKKGDDLTKKTIYEFYLSHTKYINNWDLVDLSAGYIVGGYLSDRDRVRDREKTLITLAKSENLWEKRIAIIATFAFIKDLKESKDTFTIAEILLNDKHDLIHKAVGWMLREVGKRISGEVEEEFLRKHHKQMPRTMLRYAIERFEEGKRKKYLKKQVKGQIYI